MKAPHYTQFLSVLNVLKYLKSGSVMFHIIPEIRCTEIYAKFSSYYVTPNTRSDI